MRLTPEQMPQIGPFSLIEPAGSGAMAEVWRAVHREQRVAVAIKFMTGAQARQALFRQRFAAEVRAAARLSHHGIVQLADYGTVETALDHPHLQHLVPGSPYLVMEWVPGGTLRSRLGRMQWPEIKATLLALLDALSVAHAHELVHRDIKPDNVLLSERGPLLTDFGVAFATDSTDAHSSNHTMVGTPNYMAPEQVRGDWRAFGPWTDLYALGCLAYALVEGRAPYSGSDFNEIFRGHLKGRLPVFSDERGLPEGFLAWVHRLMAKRTGQRFRFAADAAVALLDLPPPESDTRPVFGAAIDTSPGPTIVAPAAFVPVSDMSWALAERRGSLPGIPLRWHEPTTPRSLPPLSDTGRSLFDLAAPPLFGREDERNILWAALRRSSHHDCLRSVVITGQAGQGKSAIAHWLGRRAHGLGVAQRHVIRHESIATTTCGLRGMLHRLFRVDGLTDEDVHARTHAVMQECGLSAYAAAASQIIVDSAPEPEKEGQSLVVSQRDRFEVVGQILAHLCRDRAQLILVDDLQWGNETIELIQYLIRHWYRLPLLFVCTVREDGSEHDRRVRRLLAPITQGETCETIALGPLSEDAHTQLLTHRLALDDTTIRTLAARSAKNPLFTRELISHFIAEGTLVPGSNGYRLRPGGTVSLPDSVRGVWEARLHAVLGSLDDGARSILEVAAALGHSFQLRHLVSVCRG